MRNSDLDSAEVKLNRAREHVTALENELRAFGKRHPEPVRLAIRDDPSPQLLPVVVEAVQQPDPFMSAIVGDALHNFRSALDHVAWQLVRHGSSPPDRLSEEAARKIMFPIIARPSRKAAQKWLSAEDYFAKGLASWLPGIQAVHETLIRRHQPYTRGSNPDRHPFALLRALSNTDKHREVRPVFWAPTTLNLRLVHAPPACGIVGVKPGPEAGHPLRVGAEIFYIQVEDKTLCGGLNLKPGATVTLSFQHGAGLTEPLGVFDVMDWIGNEVADVLGEMDRVL
jgi:hypothetical protein